MTVQQTFRTSTREAPRNTTIVDEQTCQIEWKAAHMKKRRGDPLVPQRLVYSMLIRILLDDLRELTDQANEGEALGWLVDTLKAVHKAITREFELKARNGYLAEILEEYPHWEAGVDRLHEEYNVLLGQLQKLRAQAARQFEMAVLTESIRQAIHTWIDAMVAHRHREDQLFQAAILLKAYSTETDDSLREEETVLVKSQRA